MSVWILSLGAALALVDVGRASAQLVQSDRYEGVFVALLSMTMSSSVGFACATVARAMHRDAPLPDHLLMCGDVLFACWVVTFVWLSGDAMIYASAAAAVGTTWGSVRGRWRELES